MCRFSVDADVKRSVIPVVEKCIDSGLVSTCIGASGFVLYCIACIHPTIMFTMEQEGEGKPED